MRRGGGGYIYVDGGLAASSSGTLRNLAATIPTAVGADVRDSVSYFSSVIDDVRVYSKALAADEIKEAMRGDPRLACNPKPGNRSVTDIEAGRLLPAIVCRKVYSGVVGLTTGGSMSTILMALSAAAESGALG